MPKNVISILSIIVLLVFVGGLIYVVVGSNSTLDRRGIVSDLEESSDKVIHIQKNQQLQHYPKNNCLNFNEFVGDNAGLLENALDNSAVNNLGDLEGLTKNNDVNNLCSATKPCDGYMVVFRSPNNIYSNTQAPICRVNFGYE